MTLREIIAGAYLIPEASALISVGERVDINFYGFLPTI